MKTWITSDTHWGHANIMKYSAEPRARFRNDVSYMNEAMIREWNEVIAPDDLVYHLGDVAFLPSLKAIEILRRLNGSKILVAGNHDKKLVNDPVFRRCFKEIHNYLEVNYNGTKFVMCHFPIFDHNNAGRGSIMVHGHRHGNPTGIPGKIMDVGMDATGVIAIQLEDVMKKLEKVPHMYHHSPDRE